MEGRSQEFAHADAGHDCRVLGVANVPRRPFFADRDRHRPAIVVTLPSKPYAGTCRAMYVEFSDGTTSPFAYFTFKR
jgi:hypothetical protein